jgi:LacI family transcriptional regulator
MLRIGIQLDFAGGYGRGVIRGVMQYATVKRDWEFVMPPMYRLSSKRADRAHAPHGAVVMLHHPKSLDPFRRAGVPVVNTARTLPQRVLKQMGVPTVLPDDAAVGAMAFAHFRERGFRNFGFCGHPSVAWSIERRDAFVHACRKAGFACSYAAAVDQVEADWVKSLTLPCAVLAANDVYAWHMIDVCRELGIAVPEQIAVLGVDNDTLLSEMVRPTLSSIIMPAEQIGFEAAQLLDALLQHRRVSHKSILLSPSGIVTRHSSDVLSIEDAAVADAARFIRQHASEPISVQDVLDHTAMSRRNLERRFRRTFGRSLLNEIRRVHLDRATSLLRETDLKLSTVAMQSGFSSLIRFSTVFKELMKIAPSEYRKHHRIAGS